MKYYSIPELIQKFGVPRVTLNSWKRAGILKVHKGPRLRDRVYVSEEDWLRVPAFMRQRYV